MKQSIGNLFVVEQVRRLAVAKVGNEPMSCDAQGGTIVIMLFNAT
jgi:hypothetical protein